MTRATAELRGRIVRAIVEHAGTARTDDYFAAMADAHEFNVLHPDSAIPKPFQILGEHPPACTVCHGEGSRRTQELVYGAQPRETTCPTCGGSGFRFVYGTGGKAMISLMPGAPG